MKNEAWENKQNKKWSVEKIKWKRKWSMEKIN